MPDLTGWLNAKLQDIRPRLVVVEDVLPLKAYARLGTAEASVYDAVKRAGIVEGLCAHWKIQHRAISVLEVRQHFTGERSHGGRDEAKRATIARCRQLGYVPLDETDDNRCDALALWDWASARIGRKAPKVLTLFGGA